jgi:hypothetical protein
MERPSHFPRPSPMTRNKFGHLLRGCTEERHERFRANFIGQHFEKFTCASKSVAIDVVVKAWGVFLQHDVQSNGHGRIPTSLFFVAYARPQSATLHRLIIKMPGKRRIAEKRNPARKLAVQMDGNVNLPGVDLP